jgi:Universal stress protein UspA and related nucleotide-binding proteins
MSASTRFDTKSGLHANADAIFGRIVVGIDGTEAGFAACRQVARLADIDATIDAVAVVHLGPAVAAALDAAHALDVLERQAEAALDQAVEILGVRAHKRYLNGFVTPALLDELQRFDATLIALGTHEHRRTAEIVFGGVAGEVLHRAPCSVLIARPSPTETFPRKIVVGHDGSRLAADALAVAQHLAARYESSLRVIVALAGNVVNLAPACAPFAETVDRHPVPALVDAAREADLLSLSSALAHQFDAQCGNVLSRWG